MATELGMSMMGMGTGMNKTGLLPYLAEGIRANLPGAKVTVVGDGIEVLFTKELILQKLFEKSGNLSQITQVDIDKEGIKIKITV